MNSYRRSRVAKLSLLIAVFSIVFLPPSSVHAWWGVAHYEIAQEAFIEMGISRGRAMQLAKHAQWPDYKESSDWKYLPLGWRGITIGKEISQYFCWSHAVQDQGDAATGIILTFRAPLIPVYPDDGRYPGPIMWDLLKSKLKKVTEPDRKLLESVLKGFRAHNAADRQVHFNYFDGGRYGDGSYFALVRWQREHYDKENWADLCVYLWKHFSRYENLSKVEEDKGFSTSIVDRAYDEDGMLSLVKEYSEGVPVYGRSVKESARLPTVGGLFVLGQKVYRKNRRVWDLKDKGAMLEPQTSQKVIEFYKNDVIAHNSKANLRGKSYSRERWNKLDEIRAEQFANGNRSWQFSRISYHYRQAKNRVKNWVGGLK